MEYQQYRKGIFKMWDYVKSDNFTSHEIETIGDEEYALCGLCNPEFNAFAARDNTQPCPFDTRSEKAIDDKPCIDNCHIFTKGTQPHKLKIIMSKFMTKFVTKEGIESLKSLAKACRGQKGVSKDAALDHIKVAEKVITSTTRFGGFEFKIVSGILRAERRE